MKLPAILKRPHRVKRTGDNSPASSVLWFAWRMTGYHQIIACVAAVAISLLNLVPIELQRRIVNEIVETQDIPLLVRFGILYISVILFHQVCKFTIRLYQSYLAEGTVRYVRAHLLALYGKAHDTPRDNSGRTVSIIGAEVEKLGGFVGEELSQACANIAMLLGVAVYMLIVDPVIAVFALGVLVPQIVLTPLMQRYLNELVEERVGLLREMGDEISEMETRDESERLAVVPAIYQNRMKFFLLKLALKSILNLLNAIGPMTVLLVGGYLVMQGETQIGVIVAFLSGFDRLSSPIRELIAFYRAAAQANVQHRLVGEWMSRH